MQRFLSGFDVNYAYVASLVFGLFGSDQKVYLPMDRTNWRGY